MSGVLVKPHPQGAEFEVRVAPRAQPAGPAGARDGRLLLRVSAAPVDGAANQAVIASVAKLLHVAKSDVVILAGETSRTKRLLVVGREPQDVARAMEAVG